jgi:hypothetical protein
MPAAKGSAHTLLRPKPLLCPIWILRERVILGAWLISGSKYVIVDSWSRYHKSEWELLIGISLQKRLCVNLLNNAVVYNIFHEEKKSRIGQVQVQSCILLLVLLSCSVCSHEYKSQIQYNCKRSINCEFVHPVAAYQWAL